MLSAILALCLAPAVQSTYISQPPDHVNEGIYFSDQATYDPVWFTTQFIAETFTIQETDVVTPKTLVWWGADYKATFTGADFFQIEIYEADSAGLPGTAIYTYSGPQPTVTPTGYVPSGQAYPWIEKRYEVNLTGVPTLGPGLYMVEIHNDTTFTSDGTWGLTLGVLDPVAGTAGSVFTDDAGLAWYPITRNFAFELAGDVSSVMTANVPSVSVTVAGSQQFSMNAGKSHAFEPYLVLGSFSGMAPGFDYGGVHLSLNIDAYFSYVLTTPNSPVTPNSFGVLDANGMATSAFILPQGLSPALVGLQGAHLFVALDPATLDVTLVSNAVTVDLLP